MILKKKQIAVLVGQACGAIAILAFGTGATMAQTQQPGATTRIEITGSAIKQIDAETSVPVTIIKAEDLKKQGITTVEQILSSVSAVQMSTTTSQVVGSGSGGASFADLRGIGANKTLILLNGHRIANNAYDSSAPDLNMIPFAAIERVEVLRDGASALYGTDAVGGVINFITRTDFKGGIVTVGADRPEAAGGKAALANIGFGFGDLSTDGFNIFGFIDVNKQDRIGGTERPFNARLPGGISPTPFPANYYQDGSVVGNPAGPDCTNPSNLVSAGDGSCYIATTKFVNYTPKAERTSALLKGTALVGEHKLSLEWFGTKNETESVIAPVPYGTLWMNPKRPDGSLNPFYPGNTATSITPAFPLDPNYTVAKMNPRPGVVLQPGFVIVKWRDLATGSRTDLSANKQQRVAAQLDGVVAGWDYQAALIYNENKVSQNISGYSDGTKMIQGMLNGVINPFGSQDAAGDAFIADAALAGNLQNATGKVTSFEARASREFGDWFSSGRNTALAVGFERRKEEFWSAANTSFAELVAASTGIDPNSLSEGSRNVNALYTEMNVPFSKNLDFTVAVRYDDYSDFGDTINPKFSLRFQPQNNLLMRATYSTGFRAPSLYDINATPYYTNTSQLDDPVNCPGGAPIPGKSKILNCAAQFQAMYGGNTSLEPETAKNFTLGVMYEPVKDLTLAVDLWWLRINNQISSLATGTVFGDYATFQQYFHRNAGGDLSIDGLSCPGSDCGYVDLRTQNLGGLNTNGADLSAAYKFSLGSMGSLGLGLSSTYVDKYEYQDYANSPWNQNVGVFVGAGPVFRWQHAATATWKYGDWSVGAVGHYKSGYKDADYYGDNDNARVNPYATLDAFVSWAATKSASVTFGITNLTDRDPPFSRQEETFQPNYDPRFTDPTGRKFYLRASFRF